MRCLFIVFCLLCSCGNNNHKLTEERYPLHIIVFDTSLMGSELKIMVNDRLTDEIIIDELGPGTNFVTYTVKEKFQNGDKVEMFLVKNGEAISKVKDTFNDNYQKMVSPDYRGYYIKRVDENNIRLYVIGEFKID